MLRMPPTYGDWKSNGLGQEHIVVCGIPILKIFKIASIGGVSETLLEFEWSAT